MARGTLGHGDGVDELADADADAEADTGVTVAAVVGLIVKSLLEVTFR